MIEIAIIDYGMGNIHSVQKALESQGAKVKVTNSPKEIQQADKIVLPGVGAFDDAMKALRKYGLISAIKKHIGDKKPLLGICLGMQLLFNASQEAKRAKGIGALKGEVIRFKDRANFKVPHIGWNQIAFNNDNCPLLRNIPNNSYVYFCHSYYPKPDQAKMIAARCNHGIRFGALVWQENIYGAQFHPEKSQHIGLKMLNNFIKLC